MFNLPPDVTFEQLEKPVHEAVEALGDRWQVGLDAYDGEGGFLNGGYVWQFPRENPDEFKNRKAQARYHNYAATQIDYYVRKINDAGITRDSSNEDLKAWWGNVDGAGTDMTTYLRLALAKALAAGHVGILADKTRDEAKGPAKADEVASVFLTRYLPTAILDWRLTRDESVTAVKLLEDVTNDDLLAEAPTSQRMLLWDRDEWVRVPEGDDPVIERNPHTLGLVPLVVLRPFRHARWSFIGRSLLEGSVLVALYNRASEQDEVIRNQSFSVFVVTLPANGEVDVEKAKAALGNEVGSLRALFTFGSGDYKTPAMEVPKTLEAHQQFLIRELYRMAHIPYEKDSADLQSGEAIRLQHQELAAVLSGVADELERVEKELAKLYFAWTSATPELAAQAFEAANVMVRYGRDYFAVDPEVELKTLAAAMNAVPSKTFEQLVQKQIVGMVAPDLDEQTLEQVHQEIENAKDEPVADVTQLRAGAEARLQQALAQGDGDMGDEVAA